MITVTGLYIYPVKSLAGISLHEAELGERGFKYDREWMLVDRDNRFVSQREIPRMALVKTAIDEAANCLQLHLPGAEDPQLLSVPLQIDRPETEELGPQTIEVTVWGDQVTATVEAAEVNAALSKYLGQDLRLVRMQKGFKRKVDPGYAPEDQDIVGFADGFPILLISEESLTDLNDRLEYPVLMNRFRPNITTAGGAAFAEDEWQEATVGQTKLSFVKPCARCVITTIDQESGTGGKEPLRTMANFRKRPSDGKILFGQNAIFRGQGKVRIGDRLTPAIDPAQTQAQA
ncbi:MAG: MOSC domain-containing protein [Cyanobacteria bacterium REEB67]|nr:MOSC domain-containing protein [Cyanobacteria bacterium REEB67]